MYKKYSFILVLLGILALIFAGCGGGGDFTGPQITPTPSSVTKSVSGYVYYTSSVSGSGENIEKIYILDEPPSSILAYLTEDPNNLNTADGQELYNQISSDISGWEPLPEKYPGAKLFSVYQDSRSDTPIPVGADGYFNGTVNVRTTDATVKFQVSLDDNKYIQAESIASSDISSSSQTTGELKSCPERIFALPEECVVFEVFSTPSVNLKNAGLSFKINNASLGCVTQPFYEKVCGKNNYNVAYGIFYAKKGLTTPVDTTITAKTNTGLTINIFTEIIKSTASISGKVNGGLGANPSFGFVLSDGPCALDLLDSSGNYSLSKVFKGHYRDVLAVWWVNEGGKCVRHWELKTIDFFNGNLSDFNFGVSLLPTPTPTFPPPTDKYYDNISAEIIEQKLKWQQELGWDQGRQKTVDWLNNNLTETPLPSEIEKAIGNAIKEAKIDDYDPYTMWLYFKSGEEVSITDPTPVTDANTPPQKELSNKLSPAIITSSESPPVTLKNFKVLLLGPNAFDDKGFTVVNTVRNYTKTRIFGETDSIYSTFKNKGFDVTSFRALNYNFSGTLYDDYERFLQGGNIENNPAKPDIEFFRKNREWFNEPGQPVEVYEHVISSVIKEPNNVVKPQYFEDLASYGLIYIGTHANPKAIMACPYYEDQEIKDWLDAHKGYWYRSFAPFSIVLEGMGKVEPQTSPYYKTIMLRYNFFITHVNQNFEGSLLYISACDSWRLKEENGIFQGVQVFVGSQKPLPVPTMNMFALYFFSYMLGMDGREPMNVRNAYDEAYTNTPNWETLIDWHLEKLVHLSTGTANQYDNTYLPGKQPAVITIQKN